MTMIEPGPECASLLSRLPRAGERVHLVVSPLTDDRAIERWLQRHGWSYHRDVCSMAASADRLAFHQLRKLTGWQTLPQIFIDGDFIGGSDEFFAHPEVRQTVETAERSLCQRARLLGYAGLLPFLAGAVAAYLGGVTHALLAQQVLLAYAAVILSFVGALHWSRVLLDGASQQSGTVVALTVSVIPAVVAWLALLLPPAWGLPLTATALLALYLYDRSAWAGNGWFLRLRRDLTLGAILGTMAGWLATAG